MRGRLAVPLRVHPPSEGGAARALHHPGSFDRRDVSDDSNLQEQKGEGIKN